MSAPTTSVSARRALTSTLFVAIGLWLILDDQSLLEGQLISGLVLGTAGVVDLALLAARRFLSASRSALIEKFRPAVGIVLITGLGAYLVVRVGDLGVSSAVVVVVVVVVALYGLHTAIYNVQIGRATALVDLGGEIDYVYGVKAPSYTWTGNGIVLATNGVRVLVIALPWTAPYVVEELAISNLGSVSVEKEGRLIAILSLTTPNRPVSVRGPVSQIRRFSQVVSDPNQIALARELDLGDPRALER